MSTIPHFAMTVAALTGIQGWRAGSHCRSSGAVQLTYACTCKHGLVIAMPADRPFKLQMNPAHGPECACAGMGLSPLGQQGNPAHCQSRGPCLAASSRRGQLTCTAMHFGEHLSCPLVPIPVPLFTHSLTPCVLSPNTRDWKLGPPWPWQNHRQACKYWCCHLISLAGWDWCMFRLAAEQAAARTGMGTTRCSRRPGSSLPQPKHVKLCPGLHMFDQASNKIKGRYHYAGSSPHQHGHHTLLQACWLLTAHPILETVPGPRQLSTSIIHVLLSLCLGPAAP